MNCKPYYNGLVPSNQAKFEKVPCIFDFNRDKNSVNVENFESKLNIRPEFPENLQIFGNVCLFMASILLCL